MIPTFTGQVNNGRLLINNVSGYKSYLLSLDGNDVVITVKRRKNQRSLNQNNYYWGVIIPLLSEHLGYFPDEMHEILKGKFLGKRIELGGEAINYSASSASLNTTEFESYLSNIRTWASAELGVFLPLPNEAELA